MMKQQIRGTFALLFATVIWGSAFISQSVGMDYIGPFTFQAIRCFLAILTLLPVIFLSEVPSLGIKASLKQWLDPKLLKSGLLCGLALFVAASLQQIGIIHTSAGKAGFLTAMYIVMVPIFGIFLGRKPGKLILISVGLSVVGLYLLSCTGETGIGLGDLALIGCAIAFALQILCVDRFASEVNGLRLNCIQSLVVTVLSLPFMFFGENLSLDNILACSLPLLHAGVLSMGIAYSLQIYGQKHLAPAPAALIMSLESVFAALGGWLLLQESMTAVELTGCALMFAAVIFSQLPDKKK